MDKLKGNIDNFILLKSRFENLHYFSNGERALIRRAVTPELKGIKTQAAFDHLIKDFPLYNEIDREKWQNLAFILPWIKHAKDKKLGAELEDAKIHERRLVQMVRAKPPHDLIALKRIVQHIEPIVDWKELGKILFDWENADKKRQIIRDYFIAKFQTEKTEPNFSLLKAGFKQLNPGEQSSIRHVANPEKLEEQTGEVFYKLLQYAGVSISEFKQSWEWQQWQNVIFILPWAIKIQDEETVGKKLAKADKLANNETNKHLLFQMLRSDFPNDLIMLKRIVKRFGKKHIVNQKTLENNTRYWNKDNKDNKRQILRDYFIETARAAKKPPNKKGKKSE
jgi:CRISPR system Cascade subunit CasB